MQSELTLLLVDKAKNLYLFGTKRVTAKLQNGKLLLRVGGGYMEFEEFYKEYADQEIAKLARLEESSLKPPGSEEKKKKKKKGKAKKKKKGAETRYSMPDALDHGSGEGDEEDDHEEVSGFDPSENDNSHANIS